MDGLFELLKRVADLERAPRIGRGRYPAPRSPYKPILLLTVLKQIQRGRVPYSENRIRFEDCLQDFSKLYPRLYGESSGMESKVS